MTYELVEEETILCLEQQKSSTNRADIYWKIDNLRLETFLFLNELDTLLHEIDN